MNLGISVDAGQVRAVLVNTDGEVVARGESPAPAMQGAVIEAVRETLVRSGGARPVSAAVSYADPDSRSWPSDLSFLAAVIGENVAVRTLSTGNASALAEICYGSGKGARDLVAFAIGPSISAGVISNGALLSGAHGLASSVQWLALNPVEREDYRRMGCLEAEAGAAGIVRRLVWRVKSGDRSAEYPARKVGITWQKPVTPGVFPESRSTVYAPFKEGIS